jgi:hypothetical protein
MIDAKAAIMSNSLDIAREMARHFESGKSVEEAIGASATSAELRRACRVGRDQMAMWQRTLSEDVAAIVDMIARGEPPAGIKAAVERAKLKAETIFPMKPDKAKAKTAVAAWVARS